MTPSLSQQAGAGSKAVTHPGGCRESFLSPEEAGAWQEERENKPAGPQPAACSCSLCPNMEINGCTASLSVNTDPEWRSGSVFTWTKVARRRLRRRVPSRVVGLSSGEAFPGPTGPSDVLSGSRRSR